ncbi:MAG: cation transporter, partial [Rubrobacteraceae bacterium]|nr:cation transporter [Rubrobacteraceae bacterium]
MSSSGDHRKGPAARTNEPDAPARANGAGANGTERLQLKVGGMSCSFCVSSITKAMERTEGVHEASVNLAHEEALIEYEPDKVAPEALKQTILDLGYTVRDPEKVRSFEEEEAGLKGSRNHVLVAAGFTAASLILMILMWVGVFHRGNPVMLVVMPVFALATVFGPGRHILGMAYHSLRRGILNQHVLLEFGAFAGLAGGSLGYFFPAFPTPDFFAVATFITTYHLLSEWTSLKVRTRSSQAVRKLLELVPNTARVVRAGCEEEVPLEEVRPGELVRVRPG